MSILLAVVRWVAWILVLWLGPVCHEAVMFLAEHLDGNVFGLLVLGEIEAPKIRDRFTGE